MWDYDNFMSLPVPERRRLWATFDENQVAAFLSVHRRRWLQLHRSELTAEQCAVVEEDIEFIENELAHVGMNPEFAAHQSALVARVRALLPQELVDQLALVPRQWRQ